jgi:ABC-type Fe2+-enterobactin transport system substrate-binding protein
LKENLIASLSLSEDALNHLKELPATVSLIDLPESKDKVHFIYLSGERLYTAAGETLFVFSMSDQTSHIATYYLGERYRCFSGIITDNHLYLGCDDKLHVF